MNADTTQQRLFRRQVAPLPVPVRILLVATVVMTLGVLVPVPQLRAMIVLPIALVAPGYAVVVAAFGPRPHLDAVTALTLSVLLSMALYPLLALLLNAAFIPLTTPGVVVATDVAIVLMLSKTVQRARLRTSIAAEGQLALPSFDTTPARSPWSGLRGAARFIVILAGAGGVLMVAMQVLPKPATAPYTQFYLSGSWSRVDSIVRVRPHRQLIVALGVTNHTHRRHTYRIVPLIDDAPAWHGRAVTLAAGRTWVGSVSGDVPARGCVHRLSITLRLGGSRHALSSLTLWVYGALRVPESCRVAPARGE